MSLFIKGVEGRGELIDEPAKLIQLVDAVRSDLRSVRARTKSGLHPPTIFFLWSPSHSLILICIKKYSHTNINRMEPNKKDSDTVETLRTTASMRKKGKLVSRLIINILKCIRICCPKEKAQKST